MSFAISLNEKGKRKFHIPFFENLPQLLLMNTVLRPLIACLYGFSTNVRLKTVTGYSNAGKQYGLQLYLTLYNA